MAFTSLHRALGLQPSALSFEMLESAVAQGVTEEADLDWKETLPNKRDPGWKEEFAKDIAAMANVGGGLIIFGVKENERAAAEDLVDVGTWDDSEERQLRQVAYAHLQPVVQGLEFIPLKKDDETFVALFIPASMEVPHFLSKGPFFRAPRRYGATTEFMTEREIEAAYTQRFQGRLTREKTLQDMHEDVLLGVNRGKIWMTAVGLPVSPRPTSLGRLSASVIGEVRHEMLRNPYVASNDQNKFQYLSSPRIGFRRWRSLIELGGENYGAIEVNDDGSFALAIGQYDRMRDFDNGQDIHVMDVHYFPAYVIRLLEAVAGNVGIQGGYEVELDMRSNSDAIYIRTWDEDGIPNPRDEMAAIHRFHPPRISHDGNANERSNLEVVHSLALDLLNQGGVNKVSPTYLKSLTPPESGSSPYDFEVV